MIRCNLVAEILSKIENSFQAVVKICVHLQMFKQYISKESKSKFIKEHE